VSEVSADPDSLHELLRRAGVPYDHYKIRCIERRLATRMRARGVQSYEDYSRLLQLDPGESARLAQALTINVTRFFRNWPAFETLAREAIPALWSRTSGPIRIWSAGCAAGEEAYSIAALFHDHAVRAGQQQQIGRVQVVGSDIDEESLRTARRGVYAEAQLVEAPPQLRERYFEIARGQAAVGADLRGMVRFEHRDVILDREPDERFDLIVCRNLIIYLEGRAQLALLERFHRCSRSGAFLMLGKVEAVLGQPRTWFQPVVVRARLYRHAG
jgi:chemotaxis methyl-accepting protein methylase